VVDRQAGRVRLVQRSVGRPFGGLAGHRSGLADLGRGGSGTSGAARGGP
jgi:hypothetical protein